MVWGEVQLSRDGVQKGVDGAKPRPFGLDGVAGWSRLGGAHHACRGGPSRKTKKTVRFPVALEEVRYIPARSDLVQDDNEESALAKKKGVHFSVARQRQRGGGFGFASLTSILSRTRNLGLRQDQETM